MLKLYYGRKIEALADSLVQFYSEHPLNDPLAPEIVVVQNHGMARWLSTHMARRAGVAANLKFEFPAERVWDLYRTMDEDIPEDLPSDRVPMTWAIYQQLRELPERSPYLAVWRYIRSSDGSWSPLKAWKLANRIGDLFDQYLIYRPDMLLDWERKKTHGMGASERWQADLWRRLNNRWSNSFTKISQNHRAAIHRDFLESLKHGQIDTTKLPDRITLFGLSSLPPATIEIFATVSKETDIHWYWINPAEDRSSHDLVQSWGGEGAEFLSLFKQFTQSAGIEVDEQLIDGEKPVTGEVPGNTGKPPDLFESTEEHRKRSLPDTQVHSCHSPLREVEVLHDQLLDMFENDPNLEPDDILILTPDIQTFAPFIEAVFGTNEQELPQLPFHIVDDHTGPVKEVFNAFTKLLKLLESRFKVTDVIDLLAMRVIREAYKINDDELDRLHTWIDETNIRWGMNGRDKKEQGLPGTETFTWQFGLNRMITGFACRFDSEMFEGIYPYYQIESTDDTALLGKFSRFLNTISDARNEVRQDHSIREWSGLLEDWVESFVPANREYYHACQGLNRLIERMDEAAELAAFSEKVSSEVIFDYLEEKLAGEAARGGYFGYGVTFCGLDQMRNIPFKVVGMIGMDNEAFPRNKISSNFDLISQAPEKGDRSRRNDDRYLFLETLNAAGDLFYLSYTGQSNRDDSVRPPSVMVSELLDYMQQEEGLSRNEIFFQHPLHKYSRRYFRKGSDLFTYSPRTWRISKAINEPSAVTEQFLPDSLKLPDADESFKQLSVDDLIRFYTHPARYLLENRFGIYFRERELIEDDREPFELDGLQNYQLGDTLLKRRLESGNLSEYETIARAQGMLPDGWPGQQAYRLKAEEVEEFSRGLSSFLDSPKLQPSELSLDINNFHLTGLLESLYEDYQLFFRYGSMRPKDLIRAWIYHLAMCAGDTDQVPGQTILITKDKKGPRAYSFLRIKDAHEKLNSLLNLYWDGLHQKLPFFPKSSFSYAHDIIVNNRDEQSAYKSASRAWSPSWNPEYGEREDSYNKMLFKNSQPIDDQWFKELSLNIWSPVFTALKEEEGSLA